MSLRWSESDWESYLNRAGVKTDYEKPEPPRKIIPAESEEQRALVRWLDMRGVCFFHPANGGKRHIGVAKKLKAEGVRAGVPDIIIIDPPPAMPEMKGVALELKKRKGGVISPSQIEWLARFKARNWVADVKCGADEAIKWLKELGF